MTKPQHRTRRYSEWTTVQISPLPAGWVNVFKQDDGTEDTEPCPALLLQECRSVRCVAEQLQDDGEYKAGDSWPEGQEPPYDTQVVYADSDSGMLGWGANFIGNYERTEYRPGDAP